MLYGNAFRPKPHRPFGAALLCLGLYTLEIKKIALRLQHVFIEKKYTENKCSHWSNWLMANEFQDIILIYLVIERG